LPVTVGGGVNLTREEGKRSSPSHFYSKSIGSSRRGKGQHHLPMTWGHGFRIGHIGGKKEEIATTSIERENFFAERRRRHPYLVISISLTVKERKKVYINYLFKRKKNISGK